MATWDEYLPKPFYLSGLEYDESTGKACAVFQTLPDGGNNGAFTIYGEGQLMEFAKMEPEQAYMVKVQLLPVTIREDDESGGAEILSFEAYVQRKKYNA